MEIRTQLYIFIHNKIITNVLKVKENQKTIGKGRLIYEEVKHKLPIFQLIKGPNSGIIKCIITNFEFDPWMWPLKINFKTFRLGKLKLECINQNRTKC